MFAKSWSRGTAVSPATHTPHGGYAKRNVAKLICCVFFSLALALSGPLGMAGCARLAWAEHSGSISVAAPDGVELLQVGDPQADDTGSLDPPTSQDETAADGNESPEPAVPTSDAAASHDAPQAASDEGAQSATDAAAAPTDADTSVQNESPDPNVAQETQAPSDEQASAGQTAGLTLVSAEDSWLHVSLEGVEGHGTLHVRALGRADALWCDLLSETLPQAVITDEGQGTVEVSVEASGGETYDFPGVMESLVLEAWFCDEQGNELRRAEGPGSIAAQANSMGTATFDAANEHIVDGNCPKIKNVETGQVAWCADSRRAAPGTSTDTGDWPSASYSQAAAQEVTTVSGVNLGDVLSQLEYIMANADTSSDEGVYMAQQAIWTFTNPDRVPYGSYASHSDQICGLVDAAQAYADSGAATYQGTCEVWIPATGDAYYDTWLQFVVLTTWTPTSSLSVSKARSYDAQGNQWEALSGDVTWRLTSVDDTGEGLTYDQTLTTPQDSNTVTFADIPRQAQYRLYEVSAPSGYGIRGVIGLFCNADGTWGVWNAEASRWDDSTWKLMQGTTPIYTGISNAQKPSVLYVQDARLLGAVELVKTSARPEITEDNSCYSLEGAVYGVYSDKECSKLATTLTTDAKGHAASEAVLEEGTYWVREIEPSKGYELDTNVYEVGVKAAETVLVNEGEGGVVPEEPTGDPQAVVLRKLDAKTGKNVPQGDMSLEGAEVTMRYYKGTYTKEQLLSEDAPQPERTWVFKTDKDGVALLREDYKVSGDDLYIVDGKAYLPLGTVSIQETKAPTGYELDRELYVGNFDADMTGQGRVEFSGTAIISEVPLMGGLGLRKVDAETGELTSRGAAVLDGAVFAIYNASQEDVKVNDVTYAPETLESVRQGEATAIKTISVRNGIATTDEDGDGADSSLPFGTYLVCEVGPGTGYLRDSAIQTVEVRTAGEISWCELPFANQVVRGDLSFEKVDGESGQAMGGVAFLMTSDTTGESHVVLTDVAGRLDTSVAARSHLARTNANDAAYDSVTGALDESKLTADAGVWFFGTQSQAGSISDDLGALPYDTYTLTELASSASAGTHLVTLKATVSQNAQVIELGEVVDTWIPTLGTELLSRDGTHDAYALADEVLTDTARYDHFEAGTYTAVVELCDTGGNVLSDAQGRKLQATRTLELSGSGTYTVEIPCDLSKLAGATIVARHIVYDESDQIYASHDDLASSEQSVGVSEPPQIGTALTSDQTGMHIVNAAETLVLRDTVTYSNLKLGKTYTLTGTLMDKASSSELLGSDGKPITVQAQFTAAAASGTATVRFAFDASALAGKSIVAFEKLESEGRELATHANIDDEAQTVIVPKVATVLATAQGSHSIMGESPIDLVDTVSYANVLPGATYKLSGSLYDAKTGEPLKDAAGKEIGASAIFEAASAQGSAKVTFTGVGGVREGAVVAFEDLFIATEGSGQQAGGWQLVASHRDLADADQTVSFKTPNLRTTLTVEGTGLHESAASATTVLTDLVTYDGLEVGKTYSVSSRLVDKETGKAILDASGKAVTASGTFKATGAKGSISVRFAFDATQLAGRQAVAFESLMFEGREVAVHANLEDAAQTVTFVDIRTTATDPADGDHEVEAGKETKLVDRVEMRGLIPGQAYSLVTELVLADTHEALLSSSTRFIPTKADTTLDVTATLDARKLSGKKIVFLETLQRDGKTLVEHRDYNDQNQTVTVGEPNPPTPTPGGDMPQTGQGMAWAAMIGAGAACAVAGLALVVRKKGGAAAIEGASLTAAETAGVSDGDAMRHQETSGHIRPSRTKPIPGWRPRNGH